jgi:hypothetical protein
MASKQAGPWLLLADVERAARSPIDKHVGGLTYIDALGRAWITDSDAKAALERAEADWQRDLDLRQEFERWTTERNDRRRALAQKIRTEALAGGQPNASNQGEVWVRQQVALQHFDEQNGPLGYYEWLESRSRKAARA